VVPKNQSFVVLRGVNTGESGVLRGHPVGSRLAAQKANLEVCKLTNDADMLRD
jgi:hypothetical protein